VLLPLTHANNAKTPAKTPTAPPATPAFNPAAPVVVLAWVVVVPAAPVAGEVVVPAPPAAGVVVVVPAGVVTTGVVTTGVVTAAVVVATGVVPPDVLADAEPEEEQVPPAMIVNVPDSAVVPVESRRRIKTCVFAASVTNQV